MKISARVFIVLIMFLEKVYDGITLYLTGKQRKKPLPAEVADVYDAERYAKFLARKNEIKRLHYISSVITLLIDVIIIFSPVYAYIEHLGKENVYLILFLSWLLYFLVSEATELPLNYYFTFFIEEKYGLNKKTKKEFWKDEAISALGESVIMVVLLFAAAFLGEHLAGWTDNFSIGWSKAFLITLIIAAVAAVIVIAIMLFEYFLLRKQYTFTPLPEGELRTKIQKLMRGCKKRISEIYVYNESKKSTSKNAFLLKLLWHREFGIADNFINENAENELLAVLSHEIGHLKHRKNLLNFLDYGSGLLIAAAAVCFIHNPALILKLNRWIRESFSLTVNNYYVWFLVFGSILNPLLFIFGIFRNYRIRKEEYEADMEAVKNGYGEELIRTFKKMSSDELIDVNPHPVIEFLEFDHPGMYTRIKYIREAI